MSWSYRALWNHVINNNVARSFNVNFRVKLFLAVVVASLWFVCTLSHVSTSQNLRKYLYLTCLIHICNLYYTSMYIRCVYYTSMERTQFHSSCVNTQVFVLSHFPCSIHGSQCNRINYKIKIMFYRSSFDHRAIPTIVNLSLNDDTFTKRTRITIIKDITTNHASIG